MSTAPKSTPAIDRLVEEDERDRDGEERRRPDHDRRARRAGIADAEREEQLREPGAEQACERELPEAVRIPVAPDQRGHERARECRQDGEQGPELGARAPGERKAERHRHPAEERGRAEGEDDGVHGSGPAAPGRPRVAV